MLIQAKVRTGSEVKQALALSGIQCNAYADRLFFDPLFPWVKTEDSISVVAKSLTDLGFSQGASRGEVEQRLGSKNLKPVPLAYVPAIALTWPRPLPVSVISKGGHPQGSLLIFSPLLHLEEEFPKGFYLLSRPDGYWLRGYVAPLDYVFPGDAVFLFSTSH